MASLGIARPLVRVLAWLLGCVCASVAVAVGPLLGVGVILGLLALVATRTSAGAR
jgi:hypothetical protein